MKKRIPRPKWVILSLIEVASYIKLPGTYIDELIDHPKGRGAKSKMYIIKDGKVICAGTVRGDIFGALEEAQMVKRTKAPSTISATYRRYVYRPKGERDSKAVRRPDLLD